jgi:hypothetical protein
MISTGETPVSFTRDIWQSCRQSHIVANQEDLAKEMMNLDLQSIFLRTANGYLMCRKILRHGTFPLYFQFEGRCAADFDRP